MSFDYNELVSKTKKSLNNLPSPKEDNVKIHSITPFLSGLGYDESTFDYEHPAYHKFADIVIPIKRDEYLYIEAKRCDKEITQTVCHQCAR